MNESNGGPAFDHLLNDASHVMTYAMRLIRTDRPSTTALKHAYLMGLSTASQAEAKGFNH